jgi:hypothetical protein
MVRLNLNNAQTEMVISDEEHAKREHDRNPLDHDALHCRWCSTDRKILQVQVTQVGILQTLLQKFQEAEGTPHGFPFNFTQTNPAQNVVYSSPSVPTQGVVRSIIIGGNGNVTLKLYTPHNSIAGGQVIATLPCSGTAISIPHRFTVPLGAVFQLSTDSSSGTGMLTASIWIEPVAASSAEAFQLRR